MQSMVLASGRMDVALNFEDLQGIDMAEQSIDAPILVELLDETGQALALLDVQQDRIQWCSKAWQSALPELGCSDSWSMMLTNHPDLAQLLTQLDGQEQISGQLWCAAIEQKKQLTIRPLSGGALAMYLHNTSSALDDMHLYMQARESMFTTSRTISVSEMATTLAHEIKQPIATITNIIKGLRLRLKRDDLPVEMLEKSLDDALEQAQFTNSVINRIRDFTQARRPQQQRIDVVEITREALVLMDWLLNTSQCRVELAVEQEPLHCQGDATMLQQVLINLLRNGVEAMQECEPALRLLTVRCARHGQSVRVSIEDRGHGLKGKEQSLFVPFSTNKPSGMGVGLNICRSFVELHQGRLWLSPNADGGCTSTMELPMNSSVNDSSVEENADGGIHE
ncbi:MAG: GHKL domain-containing protein [Granulosicoccus sp.]|nr:GHKL domain-containing protein [Granulosicoccus sp.]